MMVREFEYEISCPHEHTGYIGTRTYMLYWLKGHFYMTKEKIANDKNIRIKIVHMEKLLILNGYQNGDYRVVEES